MPEDKILFPWLQFLRPRKNYVETDHAPAIPYNKEFDKVQSPVEIEYVMDKITEQRIGLLHPKIRCEVTTLVNMANAAIGKNITIRIVQSLRTIEEQNDLYAQGRTKPGKKVTNAAGGSSYHNYGLAIDFAFLVNGKEISWDVNKDWDGDKTADWLEVVQIFLKGGYEWGGNWKSIKDNPHFQKSFGYQWRTLFNKYQNKDFIPGTRYVNI